MAKEASLDKSKIPALEKIQKDPNETVHRQAAAQNIVEKTERGDRTKDLNTRAQEEVAEDVGLNIKGTRNK